MDSYGISYDGKIVTRVFQNKLEAVMYLEEHPHEERYLYQVEVEEYSLETFVKAYLPIMFSYMQDYFCEEVGVHAENIVYQETKDILSNIDEYNSLATLLTYVLSKHFTDTFSYCIVKEQVTLTSLLIKE